LDRLEPGSSLYNLFSAQRLEGALDAAALERALGQVVRRLAVLRTRIVEAPGGPVQVAVPFAGFSLPVDDLSGLDAAERDAEVERRAAAEASRPFDLAAGPPFRAGLLRLGPAEHVLLLALHHAMGDGWSMGVLFSELWALYEAFRAGGESPLPDLPVQYADYATWQREQLGGQVLEGELGWWRTRLAGAPALLELPADRPRPAVQTYRGARVAADLAPGLVERLRGLARGEGVSMFMLLLGAFKVLLSKYAGSGDVVVGTPVAGRSRGEVAGLVGCFVNTLVLRTDFSGDPAFREVLRRVRETTLGAWEHQDLPFERLVEALQPERSLAHAPLFQVMFTVTQADGARGGAAGVRATGVATARGTARFDLDLGFEESAHGLRAVLQYGTDLFDRATARRILGHLERVLEQAAGDPDVRLSAVGLLSRAERARVVEEWNRTGAAFPAGATLHGLVEAQAARTPGAVALVFESRSLTCAALNERANRLAHHLIALGVGPEARVGLCLERSLEM
ncbi:MAG TPA: condensation domain-containing protein, partial [Longimicrobiaceae bacterium]